MLFDSQVDKLTATHIMQQVEHERSSRISYYLKRKAMHEGVVTTPSEVDYDEVLCLELFPRGATETLEEYRERLKLWVPLGSLIVDRLVELALRGATYDFDGENVDEANDAIAADFEYNNFDSMSRQLMEESLGIGEMSTWMHYRSHDPNTGREFQNGGRVRFVTRYPWIAEPIVHPENVTEQIGSVAVYDIDNYLITPNVTARMGLDGRKKRRIELWLAPRYSDKTGVMESGGGFFEFENEKLINTDDSFSEMNHYLTVPVVHWIFTTDETQYRGRSFHDRYMDSWLKLNRVASNEVSQIQYLVSVWKLLFSGDKPKHMEFRPNALYCFPQGADQATELGQTERMLDLNEERQFKMFLVNTIGQRGGYSGDLLGGLEGIGKIAESGIARKIVYQQTLDTVRSLRKSWNAKATELMDKCIMIRAHETGGKYSLNGLRARVNYDDNIMPIDEKVAFELLVAKRNEGVITPVEFMMQANPNIKTVKEAEKRIAEMKAAKEQQPQRTRLLSNARINNA